MAKFRCALGDRRESATMNVTRAAGFNSLLPLNTFARSLFPSGTDVLDQIAATSTLLVSKQLFHDVGGFSEEKSLLFREDHDLVLRLAGREAAATVRKSLASVREHPNRSTKHVSDPFLRSARVYERFLQRSRDSRARRIAKTMWTRHLIWSANLDADNGRSSEARRKLFGCARSGIRTLRWWKAVLFCVLKTRLSVSHRRRM